MEKGQGTLDSSFGKYRDLLRRLARRRVDPRLRGRFDESDLVQETLLQAYRSREQVRGESELERIGWLRKILMSKLAAVHRHFRRRRRDVRREVAPERPSPHSSGPILPWLEDSSLTPSQKLERGGELARLAEALAALPEDQRMAIEMHHLQGLRFAEVAERLGRTKASVAGLVFRGVVALRARLAADETEERR
jgi:RNA polymerase sigma-70 factor (ECF subfamily)